MPRYVYSAKSDPFKTIHGEIDAESEQDAIIKITRLGAYPIVIKIKDLDSRSFLAGHPKKIRPRDIAIFTRQLASLLESGVSIINGLGYIANQTSQKSLKVVLGNVVAGIKDGLPLSESLAAYPKVFSKLYIAIVYSGEVGGTIDESLKRLADFLEKEDEFRNSVWASLAYPLFVCCVGLATVVALLVLVIPRLVAMFEDMGQALPLPTQILINLSAMLRDYWVFIVATLALAVFLYQRFSRSRQGRLFVDTWILKIPVAGEVILKTEISRLARTLSLLLSGGMPIITALDISTLLLSNEVIRREIVQFKEQIAGGMSLSRCLEGSVIFPPLVKTIVSVGEEAGTLEVSLFRVAEDFEKEVDRVVKGFTRLLEPVMILVMGLVVGFIVLSMLLPIFQINLLAQ